MICCLFQWFSVCAPRTHFYAWLTSGSETSCTLATTPPPSTQPRPNPTCLPSPALVASPSGLAPTAAAGWSRAGSPGQGGGADLRDLSLCSYRLMDATLARELSADLLHRLPHDLVLELWSEGGEENKSVAERAFLTINVDCSCGDPPYCQISWTTLQYYQ